MLELRPSLPTETFWWGDIVARADPTRKARSESTSRPAIPRMPFVPNNLGAFSGLVNLVLLAARTVWSNLEAKSSRPELSPCGTPKILMA